MSVTAFISLQQGNARPQPVAASLSVRGFQFQPINSLRGGVGMVHRLNLSMPEKQV